jgi:hypothetical protein
LAPAKQGFRHLSAASQPVDLTILPPLGESHRISSRNGFDASGSNRNGRVPKPGRFTRPFAED